jgi:hypothetical protein
MRCSGRSVRSVRPDRGGRPQLVGLGAIVPVEVEGVRGRHFVLAKELALPTAPPPVPAAAVASFFPPAKRRWGWYVLPIMFGDRFAGRIEPRIDRDRAQGEVAGLWWEDGFAPRHADRFPATRSMPTCVSPPAHDVAGAMTFMPQDPFPDPALDDQDLAPDDAGQGLTSQN